MKKKIPWLGDFLLLIDHLTYFPFPKRWHSSPDRLPQAMRFLPALGLLSGGIIYGVMQLLVVMPISGAAAVLVGLELLTGGAFLLRDLMRVADGSSMELVDSAAESEQEEPTPSEKESGSKTRQLLFNVGQAGLVWGLARCLAYFFVYLCLLWNPALDQFAVISSAVVSRLFMVWLMWYYPALSPARFHRGMTKKGFYTACCIALPVVLLLSRLPLYVSLASAFLGVYLFVTFRLRNYRVLDDYCYGAVGTCAELLYLLTWICAASLL